MDGRSRPAPGPRATANGSCAGPTGCARAWLRARAQAGKGSDVRASIAEGHALVDVEPGRQRAVPVRFGSPAGPIEVTGTRFAIMADPVATLVETWRGQVRFRDRAVPAGSGLAVLGAGSAVALTASPWAGGGIGFHPAAAAAYAGGRWLLDARAAPGAPLWSVEGSRSTMIADRDRPPEQRATGRETGTGSVEVAIPAGGWAMWRLPILPSAFRVELQVRLDPTDPVICVPAWTPRLPDRMVPPALAAGPSEWPPTETLRLLRWSTAIVGWQSEDEPIWESVCADQDDRVLQRRLGTGWTPMVGFYAERRSSIILDRIALHQLRLDGGE